MLFSRKILSTERKLSQHDIALQVWQFDIKSGVLFILFWPPEVFNPSRSSYGAYIRLTENILSRYLIGAFWRDTEPCTKTFERPQVLKVKENSKFWIPFDPEVFNLSPTMYISI